MSEGQMSYDDARVKVARIKAILESQSSVTESGKLKAIHAVCFPPKQKTVWLSFYKSTDMVYVTDHEPKDYGPNCIAIRKITLTEGEGLTGKS